MALLDGPPDSGADEGGELGMNKVFTFIVIATAVAIALSGCSSVEKYSQNQLHEICNFSKLGRLPDFAGYHHDVYYDTTTGVIYMFTHELNVSSWVPLFNADGTLKVWPEKPTEEQREATPWQ